MDDLIIVILLVFGFYGIIVLIDRVSTHINNKKQEADKIIAEYTALIEDLKKQKEEIAQRLETAKYASDKMLHEAKDYSKKAIDRVEEYISKKSDMYPQLAAIKADLLTQHYEHSAKILESKRRPAIVEAQRIRELRQQTIAIIKEKKIYEYKLAYIQELFPNIDDVFDQEFDVSSPMELETNDTTDRTRLYLSHDEYIKLPETERNQIALDRYLQRHKTNWQIGRDYELYIGYLCEKEGYRVEYTGTLKKLEDMGRDLIVSNNDDVFIVQCKNWSKDKEIHEKHIFQLFGSTVQFNIENPGLFAKAVFISTTKLSSMAEKVAKQLAIEVKYIQAGEFPRIKCNIGKKEDGTPIKIYHLPFDQQYDRVIIDHRKGEFYAMTVVEAETEGFRRAHKWIDTK